MIQVNFGGGPYNVTTKSARDDSSVNWLKQTEGIDSGSQPANTLFSRSESFKARKKCKVRPRTGHEGPETE